MHHMDNLKKMIMPQGTANRTTMAPWSLINGKDSVQSDSIFPKDMYEEEMDDVLTYTNDSENFKEEKIDSGQAEMDEKLAQYKREAERRARIEAESIVKVELPEKRKAKTRKVARS